MGLDLTKAKNFIIGEISRAQYTLEINSAKRTARIALKAPESLLEIILKNVSVSSSGSVPTGKGYLDSLTIKTPLGDYNYPSKKP